MKNNYIAVDFAICNLQKHEVFACYISLNLLIIVEREKMCMMTIIGM